MQKKQRIHILGICGTFMGGVALLAKALGHQVSGSDAHVYPPMSTQLEGAGITLMEGYDPAHLEPRPDCVVVGNVMSRGNPMVEWVLDQGLPYTSGPEWLSRNLLSNRWVLAVAGTHGKSTTSGMLAWILDQAGLNPGFLIGGVPLNFGYSARLGDSPFFVVEADEYDTAFFDKRSKFVHYHSRTAILNNLEFDHADIFDDLAMIQRQFHHLVRTVPGSGLLVVPAGDENLQQVLEMGCWSPLERFGDPQGWNATNCTPDGSHFEVRLGSALMGRVEWSLTGHHNLSNALAAIAAARHVGVLPSVAVEALCRFRNIKRRMELCGEVAGVQVYDDFAHHPTAIRLTLEGLKAGLGGEQRLLVLLDPCSNTMRMGVHAAKLPEALASADGVTIHAPENLGWDPGMQFGREEPRVTIRQDVEGVLEDALSRVRSGDCVVVMSNGSFGGVARRLLERLERAG